MAFSKRISGVSLKTRVTLVVLGGILLAFWSLAFYTGNSQREEMRRFIGRQQQAMATLVAARVEDEIRDRIEILRQVVSEMDLSAGLSDRKALRQVIERHVHSDSEEAFSAGLSIGRFTTDARLPMIMLSTKGVADPATVQLMADTMRARQAVVGRVTRDATSQHYLFSIAVPITDPRGRVLGALAGRVELSADGMVEEVMREVAMTEATYLVVSPDIRTVIAASDRARVGEPLPPRGAVPLIDSFVDGYEGSGVLIKPQGEEELVAAKGVPTAGWYVVSVVLAKDAFAPVRAVQRRVLIETSLVGVMLAGLLWWLLWAQLKPLSDTTRLLAEMSDSEQPLCLLPSARKDEIGSLIGSFNRLMEVIEKRGSDLRESESRYRMLFEGMSDAFVLHAVETDAAGKPCDFVWLSANPVFDRLTGLVGDDIIGRRVTDIFSDHLAWTGPMSRVAESGVPETFEFRSPRSDSTVEVRVFRPALGQVACMFSDISARKRAEEALRRNLQNFRDFFAKNSLVMLLVDPQTGCIAEANRAAIAFYGYPYEQLIGKSLSDINDTPSAQFEAESTRAMQAERDALLLVHRLANGELRDVEVHLSPIDYEGRTMLFSLVHDVTERKRAEDKLIQLAQTDMLTGLPNRRHFIEMAERELDRRHRYGGPLSVLMMDIDHFKKINDTYGHQVGDTVLQTVGQHFPPMLRNSDFVGRLGGEEFAAMLPETEAGRALEVAERVRQQVEKMEIACEDGRPLHFTLSIGVASLDGPGDCSLDALLAQADEALYAAKRDGRNRVQMFAPG